jgi:histidine triad (HIT) family protein
MEYEGEDVVVFQDILPKAPVHLLVVPKKHIPSLVEVEAEDWELIKKMHQVAKEIAVKQGIASTGYQLKFNVGKQGGQVIDHIHLHLLGGKQLEAI